MATVTPPGRPQGNRVDEAGLTMRQRAVLECIHGSVRDRGYPPSMREIGDAAKLSSTSSVAHQLASLERKGWLLRDPKRPRAYALAPKGLVELGHPHPTPSDPQLEHRAQQAERDAGIAEVPLVGRIAAGPPILATEDVQAVLPMPRQVVGHGDLFALTVTGQSMINAGIHNGDVVTVRKTQAVQNGDVVAALIDGEATIKKLQITKNDVRLMPCNPGFAPIELGPDDVILGKAVAILRSL
ncbi:transcriptional repressor LexA [Streptomyces sp. N35]|uniref:transcriptional repressor LexA n=1 Tax=Streptomyces sp. N35 TaxID=2795730 RepID=UPI0018F36A5A|nr:transcriptional repressor LexA [Streptomyces sp. N35]